MANKTRNQLKTQSDNTFQDSPPANITPPNHRTFNDDFVDSAASQKDANYFEDENIFVTTIYSEALSGQNAFEAIDGNITTPNGEVSGKSGIFNVLKHKVDISAYDLSVSNIIDLATLNGNIITISNSGGNTLTQFINGTEGLIIYAIFSDQADIGPTGTSQNLSMNPGDVVIFEFYAPDEVRYLGIRRYLGQEYFELADYAAYNNIRTNELLQIGSEYVLNQYYEYPTGTKWDVKMKAKTNADLEAAGYIRKSGEWIPVYFSDWTLDPGTAKIRGFSSVLDEIDITQYLNLNSEPQWDAGGSPMVYGIADSITGGDFRGRGYVNTNSPTAQKINLLNIHASEFGFFGRICQDPSAANVFYSNHGSGDLLWGNNAEGYNNGIPNALVVSDNGQTFNNDILNLNINSATYHIVNNLVTINVSATFETKFLQGVAGHEAYLYFPLPFVFMNSGSGHGSCRFENAANHQTIGVIVTPDLTYTDFWCRAEAKWSAQQSALQLVTMNFTFSYVTETV